MLLIPRSFEEPWRQIPHYYGDIIRQIFVVVAVLMLVGAPFYGDELRKELPFELLGGITLVALAALTNPQSKSIMVFNSIAAAIGFFLYEFWALYGYDTSTWFVFLLRQLIAILFMAAFYFSMKTVRANLLRSDNNGQKSPDVSDKEWQHQITKGKGRMHEEKENIIHIGDTIDPSGEAGSNR